MTDHEILTDYGQMRAFLDKRDTKYRRNFNRYANNGIRREDVRNQYGSPLAWYYYQAEDDSGLIPVINAQRSCIDSQLSKLSQTKVRPFFNPVDGTYRTRQVCRAAQRYFDQFYDAAGVYRKGIEALRDAMIFDMGVLWVDDEDKAVKRVAPWEVYYDPAELNFGQITRCALRRDQFPLVYLRKRAEKVPALASLLRDWVGAKVSYTIYWDLLNKEKVHIVNGEIIARDKLDYAVWPFALIWISLPILGGKSTSLIDDTYTIQTQLDDLVERIHIAASLSPANTVYVPQGSNVKPSMILNQIGQVIEYRPLPDAGAGQVVVSTPRFIDPQYLQVMTFFESKIYEITGTSQLSAQAKKPAGLNSGRALETLEDVESDRHNVTLQSLIRLYMDVANLCIEVFPKGEEILPQAVGNASIKWKDLERERALFRVQFSATSALSKDPKTKLEQIEKMQALGMIKPEVAASLMELPDLEDAYSIMTAAHDDIQRIIERVITDGEEDYYEVVPLPLLLQEAANTLLRLDANDEKREVLDRLSHFVGLLTRQEQAIAASQAPQPQQQPGPAPATPPPMVGAIQA